MGGRVGKPCLERDWRKAGMWHAVPRLVVMVGGENLGSLPVGGQECVTSIGRVGSTQLRSKWMWRGRE